METGEKRKLAVGYCRVSTSDQADNGLSVEAQERICTEQIIKDGYMLLKIIKDAGKSAGSLKRPGIQEIIKLASEKKIDAVYITHTDRLARQVIDDISLRAHFRKHDVELICIYQPSFGDTSTTRLVNTVLAAVNQMQRDQTAEKVTDTMAGKAKAGYFPSLAPIGYKNVKNPSTSVERVGQKIIVPDPSVAPFIKKAYELYATGDYNVFDINDILYEQGLRTKRGNKLADSIMYRLLNNSFYKGEIHWGKVHLKNGKHEAIINEELFNAVQKLMASKNKHACRRRKFQWLSGGFITCYKHECRYTAEWHLNKSLAYYHCTNRSGCGKYIEKGKLEDMVAEKFKQLEFSKDFIDMVIGKAKAIFYERRKVYDVKKSSLINQRTALEIKRKVAEDKLFADTIKDPDFKRIREEISLEFQNIDDRLVDIERERNINVDIAQEILNFTRNIYDAYIKASPKLKRQILGFFWEKFEVTDGLIIKSHPSLLFDQLLKLEKAIYKTENTKEFNVSNGVIKSKKMSAQQESNLRPSA